jgi:hypothetical protein
MTRLSLIEAPIVSLILHRRGEAGGDDLVFELRWDRRRHVLTVGGLHAARAVEFSLENDRQFKQALDELDCPKTLRGRLARAVDGGCGRTQPGRARDMLLSLLERLAAAEPVCPAEWLSALRALSYRLHLIFDTDDRNRPLNLERVGRLHLWLGPHSDSTVWRVLYDEDLTREQRYRLISHAIVDLAARSSPAYPFALQGKRALWWSAYLRQDFCRQWCLSDACQTSPQARRAYQTASLELADMYRSETDRQALAEYLSLRGTDTEREIMQTLFPTGPLRSPLVDNESLRWTMSAFFLRRYSIWNAARCLLSDPRGKRIVVRGITTVILWCVLVLTLFVWQVAIELSRGAERNAALNPEYLFVLYPAQCVAQLGLVGYLAMFQRTLMRIVMPRALFGSLLAWITVLLTTALNLAGSNQANSVRVWLGGSAGHSWFPLLVALLSLGISVCLLLQGVTTYVEGWRALRRTIGVVSPLE